MKYWWILLLIAAALVAAFCLNGTKNRNKTGDPQPLGGGQGAPGGNAAPAPTPAPASAPMPTPAPGGEEPVCGGTSDYSDPNVPKKIVSTEITAFACRISLKSYDLEEHPLLTERSYEFRAEREGGAVQCTRFPGNETEETESFTESPAFLDELQKLAVTYDLASCNGLDRVTHGLPEDFGAQLRVTYASGEKICANDNQNMFLPLAAVEALVRLFCGEPHYTSISQEQAREMMASGAPLRIVDVRRWDEYDEGHIPGAVCLPNEEIQAGDIGDLFDRRETLLLYCRSGRRSKAAAQKLAELGYRRVYEFGGILDWTGEITQD